MVEDKPKQNIRNTFEKTQCIKCHQYCMVYTKGKRYFECYANYLVNIIKGLWEDDIR